MIDFHPGEFKNYLLTLANKIKEDNCQGLASELAYNLIQSLIPTILFLVALFGVMGRTGELDALIIGLIQRFAPAHSSTLLIDLIHVIVHGSSTGLTVAGLVITLWSASGSSRAVIKGLQKVYGISGQKFPFWYSPLVSIGQVLALGLVLLVAVNVMVFGNAVIDWVTTHFQLPFNVIFLLHFSRWIIVAAGMTGITSIIYSLSLHPKTKKFSWRVTLPGTLFFLVAWVSVSLLFSLYVDKMHQFNPVYGALGALLILVTWLYYTSLLFFIGGEITALRLANPKPPPPPHQDLPEAS